MQTRLRSFTYSVAIKPVKTTVEEESKHIYAEDDKISVSTKVNVCDTVDVKQMQTLRDETNELAKGV